jgi:FAD synthase
MHERCYVAVHKKTGKFFGGKKQGTHIGYPKLNFLKSAMTNAKVNKDGYYFVVLEFNENGLPVLTAI